MRTRPVCLMLKVAGVAAVARMLVWATADASATYPMDIATPDGTVHLEIIGAGGDLPTVCPPPPQLIEEWKRTGRFQEFARRMGERQRTLRASKNRLQSVEPAFQGSPKGDWNFLLLMVDFSDNPGTYNASYFQSILFSQNTGSMSDFYKENSYGQLRLIGTVSPSPSGWHRAPQTDAYYVNNNSGMGTYPNNTQKLVEDAVLLADPSVDFSRFDNDKNGVVDGFAVC